jgi:hypothetical protein
MPDTVHSDSCERLFCAGSTNRGAQAPGPGRDPPHTSKGGKGSTCQHSFPAHQLTQSVLAHGESRFERARSFSNDEVTDWHSRVASCSDPSRPVICSEPHKYGQEEDDTARHQKPMLVKRQVRRGVYVLRLVAGAI